MARREAPFERVSVRPLVHGLLRRSLGAVLFGLGLGLGFAFQDIVENYLAGVLMSVRQPFAVNDLVDVGEHQGKVLRMTSRELVLMTVEGTHPHSSLG